MANRPPATDVAFSSSDSVRSSIPLAHAQYVRFPEPLDLELGDTLSDVTVCYETYGRLDGDASNAVLICHALSGDSHVARHDGQDGPGWWDAMVGPGRPIDTDRYFVICPNVLGGCRGTTGPSTTDPNTGEAYGRSFPTVTLGDMVRVQQRLIRHLGIRRLMAVIGGSMGGQQVLCWANLFPDASRGNIAIAAASRLTSQSLAFDIVGRNAILQDPNFRDGRYYGSSNAPDTGLAIARMIGHITYLSRESMRMKFEADRLRPRDVPTEFEKRFSVGSYLGYQGDRFVERFDANSYITLTLAMDLFDLGATREELCRSIGAARSRWLIISYTSDWLFPPDESRLLVDGLVAAGRRVSYCNVTSPHGHDSFLLERDLGVYGELLKAFLDELYRTRGENGGGASDAALGSREAGYALAARELQNSHPASIFHPDRLDSESIIRLIPPGSSVLDLGCGHGDLLYRLKRLGFGRLTGVELDEQAIASCARLGIDVIHADLNRQLSSFETQSYDCVVLSRTLQAVLDVKGLLKEIVRIGHCAIVSFPNFAYRKLRHMLAQMGRAPESEGILRYRWHDTPNLRFFSITDFEELCAEMDISIRKRIALDTEAGSVVAADPNLNADLAIFVINSPGNCVA